MRLLHRFNTVFYRLTFSYIVLVVVMTAVLGITSYSFFSSLFNDEVEKINAKVLEQQSKSINNDVLAVIDKLSIDMVINRMNYSDIFSILDFPVEGNTHKLVGIYGYLNTAVSHNSELVESMSIYYKDKKLFISSKTGVTYNVDEENSPYLLERDWYNRISRSEEKYMWVESEPNSDIHENENNRVFTFVRTYPYTSAGVDGKAYLVINVKEKALFDIINQQGGSNLGQAFILDEKGYIVSHSDRSLVCTKFNDDGPYKRIINAPVKYESYIDTIDGVKSIITYTALNYNKWKLVHVTPIEVYYSKSAFIQRIFITICVVTILLGLYISSMFTLRIYNPLRVLVSNVKKMLDGIQRTDHDVENEYTIINDVIDNLSVKVNEMESTLKTNIPLIRHNFLMGLLNHSQMNTKDIDDLMALIHLKFPFQYFRTAVIKIDEQHMRGITMENRQFILYNLIGYIDRMSTPRNYYFGVGRSDYEISIIANFQKSDAFQVVKAVEQVIEYLHGSFMVDAVAAVGPVIDELLQLSKSLSDSVLMLKYDYFFPGRKVLYEEEILLRESNKEEIPETILEDIRNALKEFDAAGMEEAVNRFVSMLCAGNYSAAHCRQRIIDVVSFVHQFFKDRDIKADEIVEDIKYIDIERSPNINIFKQRLLYMVNCVFSYIEDIDRKRNREIVEIVKKYVAENINTELSLLSVSSYVRLSPNYLSKIFKDEIGINFVDFVTEHKMNKAIELMLNENMSIEQVAAESGYSSSAYFIKKFRERYGMTPKNYRFLHMNKST